jgi:hypothetical protein
MVLCLGADLAQQYEKLSPCQKWSKRPICPKKPAPHAGCRSNGERNGRKIGTMFDIALIDAGRSVSAQRRLDKIGRDDRITVNNWNRLIK